MSAQQYGHAGQHHGDGSADCPRELHHHHDDRCDPVAVRRAAAREVYYTTYETGSALGGQRRKDAIREALASATRAKITPEVMRAVSRVNPGPVTVEAVQAALTALGFEVES